MATRCKIIVSDGYTKYSIYRHYDGYPEGVLADIKTFMENYHWEADYWMRPILIIENKFVIQFNPETDELELIIKAP